MKEPVVNRLAAPHNALFSQSLQASRTHHHRRLQQQPAMSIGSRIHGTMKSVKTSSSSSIFEKKLDALCDVTIVVEGRKLHFFKLFLRVASPVFDRMLTSDFSEKQSNEIRLPDKTLEEVDVFLQNVHPAYAWKPLDDDSLGVLLRLASEYQTEHIREKCAHYINQQFNSLGKMSDYEYSRNQDPPKKIIFYICLCEQYGLLEVRENLLQLAAKIPVKVLERDDLYKRLSGESKNVVMRARCVYLEKRII